MHNLVDESFNDPAFLEALKAAQVVFGMDSLVKGSCCLGGVRTTEKTLEDPDE